MSRSFVQVVISDIAEMLRESLLQSFLCLTNILDSTLRTRDDIDQVLALTGVASGQLHLPVRTVGSDHLVCLDVRTDWALVTFVHTW